MTEKDTIRLDRLRGMMADEGLEAIICRLPEHVVYLTNYWPHHGFSVVGLAKGETPLLFLPEIEADYADPDWAQVELFGWGLLKDSDLYASFRHILTQIRDRFGLSQARIGVELGVEITGPTYRSAEPVVPAAPWWELLEEVFGEAERVDLGGLMASARAQKTPYELGRLRTANQIAEKGMQAFLDQLEPGMTEVEVGALIEHEIRARGPGHNGARLVRASAEVGAGPVGSAKGTLLVPSSPRRIEEGDLVMVELATVVDGYWSDLTYNAVAGGKPGERQIEVYNAVLEAQQAAAAEMRPGARFSDPDTAARAVLEKAGLADHFVHITGHGVGYRYHEFIPFLMPGAEGELEEGMVSSVEPGVYIEGFGGVRIEDNVAVGSQGPDFLSTPRRPW